METEKLKWIEWSLEYVKHHQEVIEKYLDLWNKLWFLETIKFSETHTTYKQPAMVDGFLLVLENLHEKYPQNWESKIPEFQNVEEAKKWMVQQYVERLEAKKSAWDLNVLQQKAYERELHEYKEILETVDQWSMTIMAWINIVFVSQRWQELKNKNPDRMPHTILRDAIDFIPKQTNELIDTLEPPKWKKDLSIQSSVMIDEASENSKDEIAKKVTLSAKLPASLKANVAEIYYYQLFDDSVIDIWYRDVDFVRQEKGLFWSLKSWYISHIKEVFPQDREVRIKKTLKEFLERKDDPSALANYITQTMFAEYVDRLESNGQSSTDTEFVVKNLRIKIQKAQERFEQWWRPTSAGYASDSDLPKWYRLYKDRTTEKK